MTAFHRPLPVLLVEDNENDVVLLRRTIQKLPAVQRLIVLPNAERAIHYLQGGGRYSDRNTWPFPGLLIVDQMMPGLTGLDALTWLRSHSRLSTLPAVLLSSRISPRQKEQALRLKAACCTKTPDDQEMVDTLDQAMETALKLVRQSWFGSRDAYGSPEGVHPRLSEQIRVWT